ncbi:MFS transporter [Candidatus Endobugula sertula]|uniref:MFS transporter n=1 Tax=Candidatus Endobugula sertula TaxID=62101 RepID=A0A1D2QQF1_9GAMM|nr:MFS transporter [Candidatus Endobugula sertula]
MPKTGLKNLPLYYPLVTALALSLAAAVALGLSRFSYGLLLPLMRNDLGWSYLLSGIMNTGNALGYFLGVLATPFLISRFGVWCLLIAGSVMVGIFMLLTGIATDNVALFLYRMFTGIVSAFIFIAGGVLSVQLCSIHRDRAGLLMGLYYGGVGFGIMLSALLVPMAFIYAQEYSVLHAWQWPWRVMGVGCILVTVIIALPTQQIGKALPSQDTKQQFALKDFIFSLSGYFMFGVGYIGYMTFVVALLHEQGMHTKLITWFYSLLGLAVVASSRIWAGMLDHFKGGESLAILNALLGVACILPVLTNAVPVIFISGIVFGAVFLSVVASTTALVRHNLDQESWATGISVFTGVFAFGQIVGPSAMGWVADMPSGLERGLMVSAFTLFIGAMLASRQKELKKFH